MRPSHTKKATMTHSPFLANNDQPEPALFNCPIDLPRNNAHLLLGTKNPAPMTIQWRQQNHTRNDPIKLQLNGSGKPKRVLAFRALWVASSQVSAQAVCPHWPKFTHCLARPSPHTPRLCFPLLLCRPRPQWSRQWS